MSLRRPDPTEHDDYYGLYVNQAREGDILQVFAEEFELTRDLLENLAQEKELYRYAEGKWNLREIVGHLIDTEWTFVYRGMCFARQDPASLPGFDQDLWSRQSEAANRPLPYLLAELGTLRAASLALFSGFTPEAWARSGTANGCSFTVRTMPYLLAGHECHHRKVIVERYLT